MYLQRSDTVRLLDVAQSLIRGKRAIYRFPGLLPVQIGSGGHRDACCSVSVRPLEVGAASGLDVPRKDAEVKRKRRTRIERLVYGGRHEICIPVRRFVALVGALLLSGCEPNNRADRIAFLCEPELVSPPAEPLSLIFDPQSHSVFRLLDHSAEENATTPTNHLITGTESTSSIGGSLAAHKLNDYCIKCSVTITPQQIAVIDFQTPGLEYRLDIDRLTGRAVEQAYSAIDGVYVCKPVPVPSAMNG